MQVAASAGTIVRTTAAAFVLAGLLALPAVALGADAPGSPRQRLTAADNRRALSVVVRKTHLLPSYNVDPRAQPRIPHCGAYPGDRSQITITGSATSGFSNGGSAIGSTAIVFKRHADLDAYWRTTVRAEYATCAAELYAAGRREGVTAQTIEARQVPSPPTGASRTAAFRTVTRLSAEGVEPFDWYQTTVFVASGRGLAIIHVASADHACDCAPGLATDAAKRLRRALR